jgi:hypothetical protein
MDQCDEDGPVLGVYGTLQHLFQSSKYSDMMIICRGREFPAHRAIVCTQSPFFAKALDGPFKVGAMSASHRPPCAMFGPSISLSY